MFASWLTALGLWGHGLMRSRRKSSLGVNNCMLTTPTWSFTWRLCATPTMINLPLPVLPYWTSPRKGECIWDFSSFLILLSYPTQTMSTKCQVLHPIWVSLSEPHTAMVNRSCEIYDSMDIRPDQFNLLLLGYCEVKIGPSDRKKKKQLIGVWL